MYSLSLLQKSIPLLFFFSLSSLSAAEDSRQPLPISEIVKIVTANGFTDIRKIELSHDDEYEVKARDNKGKKKEIELDAYTGKILEVERD